MTEKRAQQLDALEGERQRTVKEWYTFMGQPTEYGDNILLQGITMHLKKPVQVFSYDSKDDTVYMQTMVCGILSKVETMEASSDRHRPCHVTMSVQEDHDWSFSCFTCGSLLTNQVAQSASFKFCSMVFLAACGRPLTVGILVVFGRLVPLYT